MNLTDTWLQSSWMKALGWTFVHSIWQIAVIGLLLFIILRCIPGRSAHTRYTVSTMALWATLVTALCTFIIMLPQQPTVTEITGKIVLVSTTEPVSVANQLSRWLEVRMPMMLTIWLGGVAILMLRLGFSLGWVSHIRNQSIREDKLQHTLDHIIARLKIKVSPVAAESHHIHSPVTIGHLKPLILFPIGIINQLTPSEVEAVLTHELAHIVRRDYLSNLIQSFIETLFYYHPVTWWISRMVRTERENRADDLAVSWCGDHLRYAKALMTIQEMQVQTVPNLAVGFASRKGAMLARIQRILHLPYKNHNQMEKAVLLSLCSICFLAFTLTSKAHENKREEAKEQSAFSILREHVIDSIPSSGTYKIHKKTDDKDISIEVQDGDILELKVDGKAIEPSQYAEYNGLIDELFGEMAAPPAFNAIVMPDIPEIPGIPAIPPMPEMEGLFYRMPAMPGMPAMPDMPPIAHMELEKILGEHHIQMFGEGGHIGIMNDDGSYGLNYQIITDSLPGGQTRIIILNNGDSMKICTPNFAWGGEGPHVYAFGQGMSEEEREKWAEEWKKNSENWAKDWKKQSEEWRAQAEQWKEQSKQWKEQSKEEWKAQEEHWKSQQDEYKHLEELYKESEGQYHHNFGTNPLRYHIDEDAARELEESFGRNNFYFAPSHRGSLSDEMVRDGLIEPGEEVQIQLTPEKLKINGQRMSDEMHEKYLRMYERQQGVELSGNSRVEFTTKTRQRM